MLALRRFDPADQDVVGRGQEDAAVLDAAAREIAERLRDLIEIRAAAHIDHESDVSDLLSGHNDNLTHLRHQSGPESDESNTAEVYDRTRHLRPSESRLAHHDRDISHNSHTH